MIQFLTIGAFFSNQGYALVRYLDSLASRHAESLCRDDSQPCVASQTKIEGNVNSRRGDADDVGSRPDCVETTTSAIEWQARYWEWRKRLVQAVSCIILMAALLTAGNGYVGGFAGRTLALLDPTYATAYMPIVASVSEHQPCTWTTYFLELHMIIPMLPVGLYFMFRWFLFHLLFTIYCVLFAIYFVLRITYYVLCAIYHVFLSLPP